MPVRSSPEPAECSPIQSKCHTSPPPLTLPAGLVNVWFAMEPRLVIVGFSYSNYRLPG